MRRIKPTLSICIPTYERPVELYKLVESLVRELSSLSSSAQRSVEILISDNGSSSQPKLTKLLEKLPGVGFRILFNKANIGYDRNVHKTSVCAQGDFLLFVSDDDIFCQGSLAIIMEALKRTPEIPIIFENKVLGSEHLSADEQFFSNVAAPEQNRVMSADEVYDLNVELFGGLTGLCVPSKSLRSFEPQNYFGTSWIQLALLIHAIEDTGALAISRGNYFLYRQENKDDRWGSVSVHLGIWSIYAEKGRRRSVFRKIGKKKYMRLAIHSTIFLRRRSIGLTECLSLIGHRSGYLNLNDLFLLTASLLLALLVPGLRRA